MTRLQRFLRLIPVFASAWLLSASAFAAPVDGPARLVADLAAGMTDDTLSAYGFLPVGNRSVFVGTDKEYYRAFWVTDGTEPGTKLIGVPCPPCGDAVPLGSTGSVAFYRVSTLAPDFQTSIWRTDGTPAGTFPVTASDLTLPFKTPALSSLAGGRVFFNACSAGLGCELWSSDGSRAGAAPVGEIVPGPQGSNLREVAASGDQAFMIASTIASVHDGPASLWLADGRARTLKLVREVPQARLLSVRAGRAYFLAEDAPNGLELWTSDGTAAGTHPVTRFGPQNPFRRTVFLTFFGSRVYFMADNGSRGSELWSTDGRPEGLRRLTDFADPSPYVPRIEKAGDRILFRVYDLRTGEAKLWSSRGDSKSTAPLAGCPGGCPSLRTPLADVGQGRFAFLGNRKGDGFWVTDGTGPGTVLLARSPRYHEYAQVTAAGGKALFDLTNEYETGELWVTDGTAAGTSLVTLGGPSFSHYFPWSRIEAGTAGGRLLFPGQLTEEQDGRYALWASDGTPAGSRPLTRPPIGRSGQPQLLTPLRDGLLFANGNDSREVRFVQDTETTLLMSRPSGSAYWDFISEPVDLGDKAVFLRYIDVEGISVWATDGTPAGTVAVFPAGDYAPVAPLTRFGDEAAFYLFVRLPGDVLQAQLWLTDGTPAGTRKALDLPPGVDMYGLTAIGDRLYFWDYERQGDKLEMWPWVTDGTPAGTHSLTPARGRAVQAFFELGGNVFFLFAEGKDPLKVWDLDGPAITADSGAVGVEGLSVAEGRLYFAARRAGDPSGRLLPWTSDGTDGGTTLLADVSVGNEPSFAPRDPAPFVELDGRVFFAGWDPKHGDELWSTDGTPAGTARVLDIAPGLFGSHPRGLVAWHGQLYFRARDAVHGMELWTSDGTAVGTRLVQDIAPGTSWSIPTELTPTEDGLYFSAHDGEHGRELWVLPP